MKRRAPKRSTRPQVAKPRRIETLESRQVMSADPLGTPVMTWLDSSALDAAADDAPAMTAHGFVPTVEAAIGRDRNADFWFDSDFGASAGDGLGERVETTLVEAHALTGQSQVVANYGFTGQGQTVAVIDSGIAYSHYALGGGLGAGYRVVGGYDFTENDTNIYDDASPSGGHGSHVAGIIGARDPGGTHEGVASGVDLVGLRVFDDAGNGYFSWTEQALRWVYQNRNAFANPITAVNLSLGASWNSASIPSWAMLEDEFAQLEQVGIFVAVSAGNSFTTYNAKGLSYPAASSHVVPVMATTDSGQLASFSQRHERAIGAPGVNIVSTVPDHNAFDADTLDDDWRAMSGTSMASPYLAGASVLIREAMQFVGRTGIDQWDIYDHIVATADTFFDSVTQTNYKRLNLGRAISSLMPTDDFGSTVATAHSLGTVGAGAGRTLSGVISTLTDQDHFTFTAGVTGRVTVGLSSATHHLDAQWQAWGGAASTNSAGAYVIDVVAGQSYTFALSTSDGLGYYNLSVSAEGTSSAVNLGAVAAQATHADQSVAGEKWYRVTAGRAGYFTAEALPQQGTATVAVFSAGGAPLSATASRIDVLATAGQELLVRVTGASTDFDLRLTNALSLSGSVATLTGTAGTDSMVFTVGATLHTVSLNGVAYTVSATAQNDVRLQGGGGTDSVRIDGSSGIESFQLWSDTVRMQRSGLTFAATGIVNKVVSSGGGDDRVFLFDTQGNDFYSASAARAVMTGAGYRSEAVGFSKTWAYASLGADTTELFDTAGDDRFVSGVASARLAAVDGRVTHETTGFDAAFAIATGGTDQAILNGTAGADTFNGGERVSSILYNAGQGFALAAGFDSVFAYGTGGVDTATLTDSARDDLFFSTATGSSLADSARSYMNYVTGFEVVSATATSGSDTANLFDGAGRDRFEARSGYARMAALDGAFTNTATGFDTAYGSSVSGGADEAVFHDTPASDTFSADATFAAMRGGGGALIAQGMRFASTVAHSTAGGWDRATLFGGAGADLFVASPTEATLSAVAGGYAHRANGFEVVETYGGGGTNEARLSDSLGNDRFLSGPQWGAMQGATGAYSNYASGFSNIIATSSGGYDVATLNDSTGQDVFTVRANEASLAAASGAFRSTVQGFDSVTGVSAAGGSDTADLFDSTSSDSLVARSRSATLTYGDSRTATASGFVRVRAQSSLGGTDAADVASIDFAFERVGVWV